MPYVVTERCVDNCYTDCCAVCPNESFKDVADPVMLVIDPDICIDCGVCAPECPVLAIYPQDDVPDAYKEWIQKNADLAKTGTTIAAKRDAAAGAIPLEEVKAREQAKGLEISDPAV